MVGSEGIESCSPGVVVLAVEFPPLVGAVSVTPVSEVVPPVVGVVEVDVDGVVVELTVLFELDGPTGSSPHPTTTNRPSDAARQTTRRAFTRC